MAQIQAIDKKRQDLMIQVESSMPNLLKEKVDAEKNSNKINGVPLLQSENASSQLETIF
ncbi:MAG: hypothetical protein CM1200mP3_10320 [Chloroflexota bacterium]|nr:MAG: hypothetical protein CM1200mP3_10320 [Chloroflexota bacterium]